MSWWHDHGQGYLENIAAPYVAPLYNQVGGQVRDAVMNMGKQSPSDPGGMGGGTDGMLAQLFMQQQNQGQQAQPQGPYIGGGGFI